MRSSPLLCKIGSAVNSFALLCLAPRDLAASPPGFHRGRALLGQVGGDNARHRVAMARVPWRRRKLGAAGMMGRQNWDHRVGIKNLGISRKTGVIRSQLARLFERFLKGHHRRDI